MPEDEQRDELLMSLVESTLEAPAQEREGLLRSVCRDPAVYREVRMRIEWEGRMGRFLLDPLIHRAAGEDVPLAVGTCLGERFRIVRQVGHGGMGLVFEAIDEKLDRRVALKCAKPGHRTSLPPEARAAREVSHYNVCKVHDLHTADTPSGEMEFLSMEFIDGQTLAERIRREGPVPEAQARDIARQICAGLAQAHRQGVIHGDLKCSNIILARSPEGAMRAVITDFGLAKMKAAAGGHVQSGRGGTFDYMAPELLLGDRATVASDIYALGVLFHTMLTGRAPQRLRAPSARPAEVWNPDSGAKTVTLGHVIVDGDWRRAVENLPPPWKKIVAGCLAARPAKRFASSDEVSAALEPRRLLLKSAGVAAVAVAMASGYWVWRPQPAGPPVRLAVLPFTVEGAPIQTAAGIGLDIADRLSGVRRNFTVMSPREAERNRVDAPEKARSTLGATHVLQARLRSSGAQIVVNASLSDLGSGRTIGQLHGAYPSGDAPALAKALMATVTGAFQLRVGVPKESVSGAAYVPYVQGIDLLRQDNENADQAIPYFLRAIELDPRSALPYAGLAEAQMQKFARGEGAEWLDRAGTTVAKARSINSDSVPVLLTSGWLQQHHGSYEQAIRDFKRASELDPENSEAWRRLAVAYQTTNQPDEAIATFQKAIQAQPNYYRHYLDFGNFYLSRTQFGQAEELYRRVTAAAPDLPGGHMNLGLALMQQGRLREAEQCLLHALGLRKSPRLLMNLGALYYEEERYDEAVRFFEESLASGPPSAVRYRDLGDAYRHLGRHKEAAQAYRSGRTMAENDVSLNPRQGSSRVLLALLSAFLGDSRRSEVELSQALAMEPENALVMRDAAIAYERLGRREKTLEVLRRSSRQLLEGLSRQPDVKELQHDPRFQELVQRTGKSQD